MSLGRRQELMVKTERHSRPVNGNRPNTVQFQRPKTYNMDRIHLRTASMGIKVWEAMGSPDTITVTIEVGDTRDNH